MYLRSFEYFRAMAIIAIVTGHCYGISGWTIDSFPDRVLANIISGGTHLFVFISGFLFHHVFYARFDYRQFLWKKFRNVYLPYLFCSVFGITLSLVIRGPFPEYYFGSEPTITDQIIRPALLYLWHGGIFAYWYIPFIMCLFLLSPLFIRFIRAGLHLRITIVAVLLAVSLLLGRPINNLSTLQSVVFFLPVYLFGIICSMERDWLYRQMSPRIWWVLATALVLTVVQALTCTSSGDLQKPPFAVTAIDINLLQKMAFSLFLMLFLHRCEDIDSPPMKIIASSSFSIYFLHGWFIHGISLIQNYYRVIYGPHLLLLLTPLVIAASLILAQTIKKVFPGHSRMLIGW